MQAKRRKHYFVGTYLHNTHTHTHTSTDGFPTLTARLSILTK